MASPFRISEINASVKEMIASMAKDKPVSAKNDTWVFTGDCSYPNRRSYENDYCPIRNFLPELSRLASFALQTRQTSSAKSSFPFWSAPCRVNFRRPARHYLRFKLSRLLSFSSLRTLASMMSERMSFCGNVSYLTDSFAFSLYVSVRFV